MTFPPVGRAQRGEERGPLAQRERGWIDELRGERGADPAVLELQHHLVLRERRREREAFHGVCPPAGLARLGTAGPELLRRGKFISAKLTELDVADGLDALKIAVDKFIDTERAGLLARRCDGLLRDVAAAVEPLTHALAKE